MIIRKEGAHRIKWFKKIASTAFAQGALTTVNANGFLIPGTATTVNHVGVILREVLATDADFAGTPYVPVDMAGTTDVFVADVSAGAITQTRVGEYFDLNATGDAVDLGATTVKQVYVQDINAAQSKVIIIVNSTAGADETGV